MELDLVRGVLVLVAGLRGHKQLTVDDLVARVVPWLGHVFEVRQGIALARGRRGGYGGNGRGCCSVRTLYHPPCEPADLPASTSAPLAECVEWTDDGVSVRAVLIARAVTT